jgi:ABC-type polysaccharide/polyol phosphate export permease
VLAAVTFALAAAVAYPATLIGAWFPEARPLMVSLSRATFFLAPGLVALDQMSGNAREAVRANPLTGLFESYRSVFVDGATPELWQLAIPLGAAALLLALFVPLFRHEQAHLPKLVGME